MEMDDDSGPMDFSSENSNKKTTYFVLDGSESMFMDDPSGTPYGMECSFIKGLKGIYETCVRYCVTGEALKHMVGVLVINSTETESDPDVAMGAENMKHIFPVGYLDKDKVLIMEDIIKSENLRETFMEQFGGHTRANYQKAASYSKLNISYAGTSRRFTSWIHLTNNLNPFNKNYKNDDEYRKMLRNLHDIEGRKRNDDGRLKPLRGKCIVMILGNGNLLNEFSDRDEMLEMWRTIDEEADIYEKDLEGMLFHRTGAVRAFSIIPFSLGDGLEFNVSVFSLCSQQTKPTPFKVHSGSGAQVKTVTMYSAEFPDMEPGSASQTEDNKALLFGPSDLPRRFLSHVKRVGGETIVLTKSELDQMHRFPKGIRLIEFRPIADVDIYEHVRSPWVIRPHEESHFGATSLYSHLLDRLIARKMAAICEYSARSNQKPRHVALIPIDEEKPQEGIQRGFIIVELHDFDDKLDIKAAMDEKMRSPEGDKWAEAPQRAVESTQKMIQGLMKKRFTPTAYPNPHLQAFYAMLKRESNVDAPDNETEEWDEAKKKWDQIKAWYKNESIPESRVSKVCESIEHLAKATDIEGWDPETAKNSAKRKTENAANKRGTATPAKKAKPAEEDVNLEEYARSGTLSKLTVAQLRSIAGSSGVALKSSAKKKDEIIQCIKDHYRL